MGLFDYLEEKRNEAARRRRLKEISKISTGIALGAIGGILFAPQEGKKTREDIANKSKEAANQALNAANDAKDTIQFKAYQAGEQAKKTYSDLREKAAIKKYEFDEDVEVALNGFQKFAKNLILIYFQTKWILVSGLNYLQRYLNI